MSSMFGPNRYAREAVDDTGWIALTLENSWVNFDTVTYTPARYRRRGGLVYVQGLIKDGTLTAGTILATLPAGFRPGYRIIMPTAQTSAGTNCRLDVDSDTGRIIGGAGLNASFTSITLVPFPAEL